VGNARQHEGVLQVDHHERGPARIEVFEHVLAAAALNDPLDGRFRDEDFVHGALR
jgi:hypothetical protein